MNVPVPVQLGIYIERGEELVEELNQALYPHFLERMKYRFLQEHPNWQPYEFDWAFFELKRYFVMNKILKSVPMFSKEVDEVWHEMLMFTRDYEQFSKQFYQDMLHHTPNLDSKPIPGERGFFDWVYLSLFESTPNSRVLWGGFLKYPISQNILEDFKTLSEEELLNHYFRHNGEWMDLKRSLIKKMKLQIEESEQIKGEKPFATKKTQSEAEVYQYALLPAVYFSLFYENEYEKVMHDAMPSEYYKATQYNSGSFCSGFACYVDSDSKYSGHHGDWGIPAVRVTLVVPVAPAVVAGVAVKKVIEKICF